MVPDFRRDDVWTPAFAGVTLQETFYVNIKIERKEENQQSQGKIG
jgi:hypothetical protein